MSDYIQYDTSDTVVGGFNIVAAVESEKRLVFNESYTVSGARLIAPSLYACYDLTILGDAFVEDIEVRGNLRVLGNIKAKRISSQKTIYCSGKIQAEVISANEIVANDIKCHSISISGNIIVTTTIDIDESLRAEKSVLTGEGILGSGTFYAQNAVATEYFDFEGDVRGKVLELDTDTSFGSSPEADTMEAAITNLKTRFKTELQKAGEVNEERLVELVGQLSAFDDGLLSDWKWLLENIIELSYSDEIENLRDYLMIIMAKKVLPQEIIGYETIEHVFGDVLKKTESNLASLVFHAKDIADFAYALKIVCLCESELNIDKDEILDRIFQSIGIKYKTVKSFLNNKRNEVSVWQRIFQPREKN